MGWNSGACLPAEPDSPAGPAVSFPGPFEAEADARALPAVQAIYRQYAGSPGAGRWDAALARLITDAASAAGVELGAFDRRVIAFLAGWQPEVCAAVAAMIARAAHSPDTR
jgi:hypothetical protein